jgi:hypothetical protein
MGRLADGGFLFLDGEKVDEMNEKLYYSFKVIKDLEPGEHTVVCKLFCLLHCRLVMNVVTIDPATDKSLGSVSFVPLPECPPIRFPRKPYSDEADPAEALKIPAGAPHVRVHKDLALREWRENYPQILAKLNPQPIIEDGKVTGIACSNPEDIPSFREVGIRNGDILISLNGLSMASGMTVFDIAKATEGSKVYDVGLLREGKEHHIFIEVDGL